MKDYEMTLKIELEPFVLPRFANVIETYDYSKIKEQNNEY